MTVASGAAGVFPVSYGYYPAEGSRCVTAQYNWASQAGYAEDFSQLVARGVETTIQSAFIDNGANAQSVTLTIGGTGHVVTCPANSQGVFPLYFTGTPTCQIVTSAPIAAVTRIYFVNVPSSPSVWHV
jgi:hypothetical protein